VPGPFPKLSTATQTSPATEDYNCIAWAFFDNSQWWWPGQGFWPIDIDPGQSVLESFEELFAADGWVETSHGSLESGFIKIALYTHRGVVTHAARQLPTGEWTSKLGKSVDIAHTLGELDGPMYGTVHKIYKRPT
jgi:hypothetical protein